MYTRKQARNVTGTLYNSYTRRVEQFYWINKSVNNGWKESVKADCLLRDNENITGTLCLNSTKNKVSHYRFLQ